MPRIGSKNNCALSFKYPATNVLVDGVGKMSYKIDNVNGQAYDEMCRRLIREDNRIFHPRTNELILGCTQDKTPRTSNKHLNRFPRVAYHRTVNGSHSSATIMTTEPKPCFVVQPDGTTTRELREFKVLVNQKGYIEKTSQYKTVWLSKHSRRQ